MKVIPIESADNIYKCGKVVSIRWRVVKFPEMKAFATLLDKLVWALGESAKDDYWIRVIRDLKRFRFDCCAAPLSNEILQQYVTDLSLCLKGMIDPCKAMYPNASRQLSQLLTQLHILSTTNLGVLLGFLSELPDINHKEVALVIREPRLVLGVKLSLGPYPKFKNLDIINQSILKEERCYKRLVIIGPSRWYEGFVFSAPRAANLLLVRYAWIKDQWKQEAAFMEPVRQRATKEQMLAFEDPGEDSTILPEELLPSAIDFQRIAGKAMSDYRDGGEGDEFINARVFVLEEGWAVFLEADETDTVLVIDFESDEDKPVRRIKIGEVNIGMYVLLRTGGGGDYIVPVADKIMGEKAPIAREFQKEWKNLLREKVRKLGYERVIAQLEKLGSIRASRSNIHNWMYERGIKTEDIEDFRAIMRLVGLDKHTIYYWDMMKLIERAHLMAGMQIRRSLLEQVSKCDMGVLKRLGKMEFALPNEQSVSITAFQIKDISPDVIPVPHWHIGVPFEPDL
jgi:hypothetical protein